MISRKLDNSNKSGYIDSLWYMFFKRLSDNVSLLISDVNLIANEINGNISNLTMSIDESKLPISTSQDIVGWNDMLGSAVATILPVGRTEPPFDDTNIGYSYNSTSNVSLPFAFQLSHSYKQGSNVIPHIHWEPITNASGNVQWRMEYCTFNRGNVIPERSSWTNIDLIAPSNGIAKESHISSFGNISIGYLKESAIIKGELWRMGGNTADTYNANTLLDYFDIHYQIEKAGTAAEYPP